MARSRNTLMRRSGVAVVNLADLIEWKPNRIFQVGIGRYHQEADVFVEKWPGVELIGFEPNPMICEKWLGDYPGKVYWFALGVEEGFRDLFWNLDHLDGASHWKRNDDTGGESVLVRCLDGCFNPPAVPTLLWLDCEGAELNVLKGAEWFVRGRVEVINVELTGKPPREGWPSPVEVNRWLLDHGFLLQFVHTQRMTSGQADCVYVKPELFRPEYCSCPLQVEDHWRKYGDVVAKEHDGNERRGNPG